MSQQVNIVSTQVKAIVTKQEVNSLTEKLENLDINDTSTPLISKRDEKLKEAETSTPNPVKNIVNILEKDLSQSDNDFQNINKVYKKNSILFQTNFS